MTVWNVASIDDRPELELVRWRIMRTNLGDMHFVGCETLGHNGRVSSTITDFDPAVARGFTRSGRVYLLSGPSGFYPAAQYVWTRWCEVNKVSAFVDISLDAVPKSRDRISS
ncbi:hypothetical protein [Paraburkholderia sp. CI3]|uniref:hypothetical protein n=1 Tax=Paraburkholderia sp. CI3 TaxID=2991060 RepID=UPI003D202B52